MNTKHTIAENYVAKIKQQQLSRLGLYEEAPGTMSEDEAMSAGYELTLIKRPKKDFATTEEAAAFGFTDWTAEEWVKRSFVKPLQLTDEDYMRIMNIVGTTQNEKIRHIDSKISTIANLLWFWSIVYIISVVIGVIILL